MDESDFPWALAFLVVGVGTAGSMLLSVLAWQISATWRARIAATKGGDYQSLAQETASAMRNVSAQLTRLSTGIKELRERTSEVERMLKEI